jgi:anti-sigma-K factor RskA
VGLYDREPPAIDLDSPGSAIGRARTAGPAGRVPRWRLWIAGTIAACVLVAGAATTTHAVEEPCASCGTDPGGVDRTRRRHAVRAARGGDQVTAIVSAHLDAAVVLLATLAAPDRAHAYQLWLIEGGRATSAGVLPAGRNGGTRYVSGIGSAEQLGVTVEPAGGSSLPAPPRRGAAALNAVPPRPGRPGRYRRINGPVGVR